MFAYTRDRSFDKYWEGLTLSYLVHMILDKMTDNNISEMSSRHHNVTTNMTVGIFKCFNICCLLLKNEMLPKKK